MLMPNVCHFGMDSWTHVAVRKCRENVLWNIAHRLCPRLPGIFLRHAMTTSSPASWSLVTCKENKRPARQLAAGARVSGGLGFWAGAPCHHLICLAVIISPVSKFQ